MWTLYGKKIAIELWVSLFAFLVPKPVESKFLNYISSWKTFTAILLGVSTWKNVYIHKDFAETKLYTWINIVAVVEKGDMKQNYVTAWDLGAERIHMFPKILRKNTSHDPFLSERCTEEILVGNCRKHWFVTHWWLCICWKHWIWWLH